MDDRICTEVYFEGKIAKFEKGDIFGAIFFAQCLIFRRNSLGEKLPLK